MNFLRIALTHFVILTCALPFDFLLRAALSACPALDAQLATMSPDRSRRLLLALQAAWVWLYVTVVVSAVTRILS